MLRPPREDPSARVGRLYAEHGAALYRYAVIILADAAAAEDAIQQVFAAVLRQRGGIDNEAHYLRRAVRNECYSMLRHRRSADEYTAGALLEPVKPTREDHVERIALERAIRASA
jgi:DNA-directed RNA polymerase specialized sigma24 family protein